MLSQIHHLVTLEDGGRYVPCVMYILSLSHNLNMIKGIIVRLHNYMESMMLRC
jgi:hypothetical protein